MHDGYTVTKLAGTIIERLFRFVNDETVGGVQDWGQDFGTPPKTSAPGWAPVAGEMRDVRDLLRPPPGGLWGESQLSEVVVLTAERDQSAQLLIPQVEPAP